MVGDFSEQRRFSRIPSTCSVLVRFPDGAEPQRFSNTQVVGMGGCSFLHPRAIPPGTHLWLDIAVGPKLVEAEAQVAYSRPTQGPLVEVGVEFLRLSASDRASLSAVFLQDEKGGEPPSGPGEGPGGTTA